MADNVNSTAANTVATDDVGGVHYQRTKVVWGADGSVTDASLSAGAGLPVQLVPGTAGGLSISHLVAAGSGGDATVAKASAGQLYGVDAFNVATTPRYLKFHNSTAAPTPGTGVVLTIGLQAGVGRTVSFPGGVAFSTGIGFSLVTGIADNSTASVTAADVVVDVFYK